MIHLPEFQEELDRLDYQGERRFRKAQRAQRDAERTQKPEYQKVKATVAPNDRHTRTRSREGHRRPRGHQSQLRHCPPLDPRLEAEMTAPRIADNN